MPKKNKSIPVNPMFDQFGTGIEIGKASVKFAKMGAFEKAAQSHRDDYHLFFLQEKGSVDIEVDFQKHRITPFSVVYIHPNQVHRMLTFENVTVTFWAITNEKLHPEYLKLLEDISPARPLSLNKETFSIVSEAAALCIKLSKRKYEKLFNSLLKDSCNTLVALVASQYLEQMISADKPSRFEVVAKAFKLALEHDFITIKSPKTYAQKLNISTPYLNECVKNITGHSVSYHIQQRVILEAKRLLYHSDKSVKEIANELGYDDYPYFSRLFRKATGITALSFRNKNHD